MNDPVVYICVISMMNVGVQCCKRNGVSDAIGARQKIRVDPFASMTAAVVYSLAVSFPGSMTTFCPIFV